MSFLSERLMRVYALGASLLTRYDDTVLTEMLDILAALIKYEEQDADTPAGSTIANY